MPHAAQNLNAVLLDLHASATTVALLPPPQFVIDLLDVDGQPGRQTFDDRDQRGSM